jgi:hypothetical protein
VASAPPSASRIFIILAVAEGELSRGSTSRMGRQVASSFSIQGRRRSPALWRGANSDNAGPVGRKHRQLQRAWLAGSAGSVAASDAASCRLIRAWPSFYRTGDCHAARRSGMSAALLASPTAPGDL